MPQYLILDPAITARLPSNKFIFMFNAILGTIVARSRAAATKKAIQLGIDNPIALIYSELDDGELKMAELAPILDAPKPVGRPLSGHRCSLTLTGLSDADLAKLKKAKCRGAYVVGLIRKDI